MSLASIPYGGVVFPCSRAGTPMPTSTFDASRLLATCDVATLRGLHRPADAEIQRIWIHRFVYQMHWLPMIKLLSGCRSDTDPESHAAFMTGIAEGAVDRIAHRPWGKKERLMWGTHLRDLEPLCPDSAARRLVRSAALTLRDGTGDVFFVADAAIAAAEAARPACTKETPWLLYKALRIIKGPLLEDEHRVMMFATYGDDPSCRAYWQFVKGE